MAESTAAVAGGRAAAALRFLLGGAQLTSTGFSLDRFLTRARALFFARLAFLLLGLGILAVPAWSQAFGVSGPWALAAYLGMVAYGAVNFVVLPKPGVGRAVTFATLCLDLVALLWLAANTGGLRSPLLAAQLLFTTLFVTLFPTRFAVVPLLLSFPVLAGLGDGRRLEQVDLFILLWYSALDCILVYVLVYLNERDRTHHLELQRLSRAVREMAVVEERNRLSRDIHDGLGGVLSSVVIQSEYLLNLIDGSEVRSRLAGGADSRAAIVPTLRKELSDLHQAAEDSMDELRRSLRMMKEDFDLVSALGEACRLASARHRLDVRFGQEGRAGVVGPESSLALFRVLQEALTNVSKHCGKGTRVDVTLSFGPGEARLRVRDHGPGFLLLTDSQELARKGHYGLANMGERANKVSGRIRITSAPGEGTCIELVVPSAKELV